MLIILLTQFLIPLFFCIFLVYYYFENAFSKVINITLVTSYVFFIYLVSVWPFGLGYYSRYFIIIVSLICITFSIFFRKKLFFMKKSRQNFIASLIYSIVSLFFSYLLFMAILGQLKPDEKAINLEFPLKHGNYYIIQGGNSEVINHHYSFSAQKYALDIIQLNSYGFRSKKMLPTVLEDYTIYDSLVYSPCDCIVIKLNDQFEDLIPGQVDIENPQGNHVVIKEINSNKFILLAHLKKNSVMVHEGESLKNGQLIARVGNSGNTTEPHLHIHCVEINEDNFSERELLYSGKGIPMLYDGKFLVRNDLIGSE